MIIPEICLIFDWFFDLIFNSMFTEPTHHSWPVVVLPIAAHLPAPIIYGRLPVALWLVPSLRTVNDNWRWSKYLVPFVGMVAFVQVALVPSCSSSSSCAFRSNTLFTGLFYNYFSPSFCRDALKEQFGKDQTRSDAWPWRKRNRAAKKKCRACLPVR